MPTNTRTHTHTISQSSIVVFSAHNFPYFFGVFFPKLHSVCVCMCVCLWAAMPYEEGGGRRGSYMPTNTRTHTHTHTREHGPSWFRSSLPLLVLPLCAVAPGFALRSLSSSSPCARSLLVSLFAPSPHPPSPLCAHCHRRFTHYSALDNHVESLVLQRGRVSSPSSLVKLDPRITCAYTCYDGSPPKVSLLQPWVGLACACLLRRPNCRTQLGHTLSQCCVACACTHTCTHTHTMAYVCMHVP